jgi:hypothetical protein
MADHPVPAPARDLTEEEHQKLVEQVFGYEQAVKAGLQKGREALWQVAEALSKFDADRGWQVLGHDTLTDWLADPEIGMPRSTYYRLVRVWDQFVIAKKVDVPALAQVDPSKVDLVLPALKNGTVTTKKALKDVEALGWRDLREKYAPAKPQVEKPSVEPAGDNDTPDGWSGLGPTEGVVEDDGVQEPQPEDVGPVVATIEPEDSPNGSINIAAVLDIVSVLERVRDEVAPPAKKKMANDLREEIYRVLAVAQEHGWANAV